jgi:hypothetical protein
MIGTMPISKPPVAAALALLAVAMGGAAAAQHKPADVPVDFSATVDLTGAAGSATAAVTIHIAEYTRDFDRNRLVAALTRNGYQTFLPALKVAPVVGSLQIADRKWDLRWAHQEQAGAVQVVTVATAQPVYFVGGGRPDAKPRTGYEMAVIRLELDAAGAGKGTVAAAARVKPSADRQSVQVDDYADTPLVITKVTRRFP